MREDVRDFVMTMEGTTFAERRANALVVLMYDMVNKKEEPVVIAQPMVLEHQHEHTLTVEEVKEIEKPKKKRKKKVEEEVK